MSKPYWKTKITKKNIFLKKNFWDKKTIITKQFQGLTVGIYNGKEFKSLKITENHVGYKLGEFIATRKPYKYKGKKKIIKKN